MINDIEIDSLNIDSAGEKITILCKIDEIYQTSGPTLFTLFDGSGTLVTHSFAGPKKRAFPELKENDIIHAAVLLKERDGNLEGELQAMRKRNFQKISARS